MEMFCSQYTEESRVTYETRKRWFSVEVEEEEEEEEEKTN